MVASPYVASRHYDLMRREVMEWLVRGQRPSSLFEFHP